MINEHKLSDVKEAINRFGFRLKMLEARIREDKGVFYGCKETAALKRASMDLSEALINLRK